MMKDFNEKIKWRNKIKDATDVPEDNDTWWSNRNLQMNKERYEKRQV